ncbi:hypothetical protein RvY_12624 [Ramazzottius varieornatus]|uniref:Uncharacterized protein n=1 Tax=Ramazzottius varieornatus TaxID=947166 RepID=A0A1D1VMF0_RAMVA|nr:hypothetical protein RvY_12624 [Ramazzottius varieornatus]
MAASTALTVSKTCRIFLWTKGKEVLLSATRCVQDVHGNLGQVGGQKRSITNQERQLLPDDIRMPSMTGENLFTNKALTWIAMSVIASANSEVLGE